MTIRFLSFILLFAFWSAPLHANPMESLLKKQIAEQRYQKMAEKKRKHRTRSAAKQHKASPAPRPRAITYETPPYKIILISGVGKKLSAHLIAGQNATPVIVRTGDKLDYNNFSYRVVLINERRVVLKRARRRYEIPFIKP